MIPFLCKSAGIEDCIASFGERESKSLCRKPLIPGHSICITVGFGGFSFQFYPGPWSPQFTTQFLRLCSARNPVFFLVLFPPPFFPLSLFLSFPCCVMFLILRFSFANVIARLLEAWLGFFVTPPLTGDEATLSRFESDGLLVLCGP